MKKTFILVLIILLFIISACSDKEEVQEKTSDMDFKEIKVIVPDLTMERFSDFFSTSDPILTQHKCDTVVKLLDELKPVTIDLIKSTKEEETELLEIANGIVEKDGFNNLDDYAIELDKVTWTAGTYMKMLDLEVFLKRGKEVPAVKFLGENLGRRFEKYPMTRTDVELIISNWNKIESALHTMNDLAKRMDEYRQKNK